jgi:hypothetical protein
MIVIMKLGIWLWKEEIEAWTTWHKINKNLDALTIWTRNLYKFFWNITWMNKNL